MVAQLSRGQKIAGWLFWCLSIVAWVAFALRFSLWLMVPLSVLFGVALGIVRERIWGRGRSKNLEPPDRLG
jgi:ABC-type uncharacterized transport system permease subunit